ncbi:MAG: serine hydrolase [Bacteroidetes bacterium]|nr:serine hydrolase [Bacteroidota bacterium]
MSLLALSGCHSGASLEKLENQINEEFGKVQGIFAVAFKDLSTGTVLFINEHESFHAASTMKTPVLIEVYKQASEGRFTLTDSIEMNNTFKSIVDGSLYSLKAEDDSEKELYNITGKKRTISDLVYDMIIVSSNLATNIIIELVGADNVTQTMRDLGAPDIQVLRGVEDIKAFELGMSNTTTAYDLMVIFERMAKGETVSTEASEAMINILLDQKFNKIIPAKLPDEVRVAHKTGAITGVHHDSGIVFLPDGRNYVLVLLSKEVANTDAGTSAQANVSRYIYDFITH